MVAFLGGVRVPFSAALLVLVLAVLKVASRVSAETSVLDRSYGKLCGR